jgi:hypothetical protein
MENTVDAVTATKWNPKDARERNSPAGRMGV